MKRISLKTQLIIFLAGFALFLAIQGKNLAFLFTTCVAIISAAGLESVIYYFKTKKFTVTQSSLITGLIIGFVLSSGQPLWLFFLAALSAIAFKHILRFSHRHIFNPAAFGVFLTIIFFGASTGWQGTYRWYILVPFGIYFAYRIKKLEVVIGYAMTFLILFGSQALLQKVPLLSIFGYLSYFFIFVMVIEPKTTPLKPAGKLLFGAGVAALIFILTEAGVKFDAELFALLVLNMFVPLLNKIPPRRLS